MYLSIYKNLKYPSSNVNLIATESIGGTNNVFNIHDFGVNVSKWLSSYNAYFKSSKVQKALLLSKTVSDVSSSENKIHDIIQFYNENSGDLTEDNKFYLKILSLFPFLAKKKYVDRVFLAGCLVNPEGNLFDYKTLCATIVEKGYKTIFDPNTDKFSDMNDITYYLVEFILESNGYVGITPETYIQIYNYVELQNDFYQINNLNTVTKFVESFYTSNFNKIKSKIKQLENELNSYKKDNIDNNDEVYKSKYDLLNRYYAYVKLLSYPAKLMFDYVRYLEYFGKLHSSVEYTTTFTKPPGRLFHLSTNPDLGVIPESEYKKRSLSPRPPQTGLTQLLPPRVCFAPDVLLCCYGIPYTFDAIMNIEYSDHFREEGEFCYIDLYLYEGIPEKGRTRYIKPEYIIAEVGESMFSKEIAVVSPIRIKRIGKVEIKFRYELDIADPRKFVDFKLLKE